MWNGRKLTGIDTNKKGAIILFVSRNSLVSLTLALSRFWTHNAQVGGSSPPAPTGPVAQSAEHWTENPKKPDYQNNLRTSKPNSDKSSK